MTPEAVERKITEATPLKQVWTEAVSRVGYTVRGSTWSDNPPEGVVVKLPKHCTRQGEYNNSPGGVVIYEIRTLRARNDSIPPEMASNLSIRVIHDYSDSTSLHIRIA